MADDTDGAKEIPVHVRSGYGANTERGFVHLIVGDSKGYQFSADEAREIAALLWEAAEAALVGAAMMARAIEAAILVPSAVWIIGQILDLAQAVSDLITNHAGHQGAAQLVALAATLTNLTNPLELVAGVVGVVVLLLVVLIKLMSVAVLAWLACVGVLALATWPMGSRIAGRWLWNFTAVALWGAGWALWLKIVEAVLSDFSLSAANPTTANGLFQPFVVVALLLFGFGVPRAIDELLQTHVAPHGTGVAGFVVGVGASVASGGASGMAKSLKGRLFG